MAILQYQLRNGIEADREALQALLARNQMETNIDPVEFLIAEIEGQLSGAARLEYEANIAYLRPVVVDSIWQGKNIGHDLVNRIAQDTVNLRVVARGEATGFYRKLGFLPISWDLIHERYRQECCSCPALSECQPEPMAREKRSEQT